MLSIIIPTYNEEKFLPDLLKSKTKQSLKEYEIIIADNSSKDNTKKIAKKYKCKVVNGGRPSKARNNGAKAAKSNDLLFLDADVILPKSNFLKNFFHKIGTDSADFATCRVDSYSHKLSHRFFYMLKNYGNFLINFINPHVSGQCFYVKKELFDLVDGYDESLYLGEEHDLAQKLSKTGKGMFYMDIYVLNNPRRLEKDGVFVSIFRSILSELYRFFIGKITRETILQQEYGKY